MQVSAEMRWFWRMDEVPPRIEAWFRTPEASAGELRTDVYFSLNDKTELGIKRRDVSKPGRGVEIKGLVAEVATMSVAPFTGCPQIWTKWTTDAIDMSGESILTKKLRYLRKFATDETGQSVPREIPLDAESKPKDQSEPPKLGCNVELTRVWLPNNEEWWTLGFEAFGNLHTVEQSLRAVVFAMAETNPPNFAGSLFASYPAWLKQCGKPGA